MRYIRKIVSNVEKKPKIPEKLQAYIGLTIVMHDQCPV